MQADQKNIFTDIRILDLTRLLPGGFCTQIWADLGAEVIKVEEKKRGDYCRWDPPILNGQSHYFLALNRNKKSITLNLKAEEGKRIFIELAKTSDVIIENFRPGVMDRLGIGYPILKEINQRLVYCSISGYSQDGPDRDKAGHDINFLADTGYLDAAIKSGGGIPSLFISDMAGSMFASLGISMALLNREKTGFGKYLDISIMECFFSWMTLLVAKSSALGRELEPDDFDHQGSRLSYNVYRAADGQFIALGIIEEKFWVNFCHALDIRDLLQKQFAKRSEDPEAFARLEKIFATKNKWEWEIWAKDLDLCLSPVKTLGEVLYHSNSLARKLTYMMNISGVGEVIQMAMPFNFSTEKTDDRNNSPPPVLGQHTDEILASMGMDDERIRRFKETGIV